MKILMLTPDAQMIDRRILQEARTLLGAGHEVTLLAGFECGKEEDYWLDGIHVCRFQYDWDDERLKRLRRLLPLPGRLQRLLNRAFLYLARRMLSVSPFDRFIIAKGLEHPADVVHVHDLPALQAGVVLAHTWGVPLFYDAHEMYYAQDVLPPRLRHAYFRAERRLIRHPDAVITVNDFIADLMAERYGIARPHVLYNCADPEPGFDPARARTQSPLRQRVPGPGPILLFQGWLSHERNIDTLIRALAHVPPPARLAVIGYGAYQARLEEVARASAVADRVHFLGRVESRDMLDLTVGADLGLIPYLPIDENHLYCSPNKFFEYVQACLPILAHDLPFFRLMGKRHGVVRCADFTSPPALGQAIATLLADGSLEQMRQACVPARQVLTWPVEGRKLLTLYDRLAAGPRLSRQSA